MKGFNFGNVNRRPLFDIETEDFEYFSLKELFEENDEDEEKVYPVFAVYINTKGKFGDAPVVALEDRYVNLPENQLEAAQEILESPAAIDAINNGNCGIQIRKYYKKKFDKWCYTVDWVNI